MSKNTEQAVAWLIERVNGSTEVVLSPLTDDHCMMEGDEATPLFAAAPPSEPAVSPQDRRTGQRRNHPDGFPQGKRQGLFDRRTNKVAATQAPTSGLPDTAPNPLVVTLDGVPMKDQAEGIRLFKEASLRKPDAGRRDGHSALRVKDGKRETFDPHPDARSKLPLSALQIENLRRDMNFLGGPQKLCDQALAAIALKQQLHDERIARNALEGDRTELQAKVGALEQDVQWMEKMRPLPCAGCRELEQRMLEAERNAEFDARLASERGEKLAQALQTARDKLLGWEHAEQRVAEQDAEIAILKEELQQFKSDNGIFGVGA